MKVGGCPSWDDCTNLKPPWILAEQIPAVTMFRWILLSHSLCLQCHPLGALVDICMHFCYCSRSLNFVGRSNRQRTDASIEKRFEVGRHILSVLIVNWWIVKLLLELFAHRCLWNISLSYMLPVTLPASTNILNGWGSCKFVKCLRSQNSQKPRWRMLISPKAFRYSSYLSCALFSCSM